MNAEPEGRHGFCDAIQKSQGVGTVDIDDRKSRMILELHIDADVGIVTEGRPPPPAAMTLDQMRWIDASADDVLQIRVDLSTTLRRQGRMRDAVDDPKLVDHDAVVAGKNVSIDDIGVIRRQRAAASGENERSIGRKDRHFRDVAPLLRQYMHGSFLGEQTQVVSDLVQRKRRTIGGVVEQTSMRRLRQSARPLVGAESECADTGLSTTMPSIRSRRSC